MRIHLLDTPEPAKAGHTLTANCGVEVQKAEFAFFAEGDARDSLQRLSLYCCAKCYKRPLTNRYIYGIVDGQLAQESE